ncbi:toprim domain-containing protein [Hyphomicrobium sp. DY-1]|uniref:DUF7146 domain-containing protein n=1 Tax=Hyphomicrobium sp. DY-1 TaxID=3075650 RepID=UPI0039C205B8
MSEARGPSMSEIKAMLQTQIEPLARALCPQGSRSGKWWLASNPTRADDKPSLGIGLTGVPGAWKDFATGDAGDVFDLIAYVNGFPSMKQDVRETMRFARAWLGIEGAAPAQVQTRIHAAKVDAERRAKEAAARLEKAQRRAKAIYLDAKKLPFNDTLAATYLATRGLDVRTLGRPLGCLGYLDEMWHSDSDSKWPVMIAAFTDNDGRAVAIHRTYLARDGRSKAPVTPARKIWPAFGGAAIRLWRGESGLSIDKANEQARKHGTRETLILVEGVEDGLSVAIAAPQYRVWCAGSLSNLANIKLPECVDEVIVCADNDWGKSQAQQLLERGIDALGSQNVVVRVARSNRGKDMNDALVA